MICLFSCSRLGVTSLAYLWRKSQPELLKDMIASGLEAVVIKVATLGLEPRTHLGKSIAQIYSHMLKMVRKLSKNCINTSKFHIVDETLDNALIFIST